MHREDELSSLVRTDLLILSNATLSSLQKINFKRGFQIIRDPRDIAVSSYFSHLYSHSTRYWEELIIDQLPESIIKTIPIKAILLPTIGDYAAINIVPASQAQAMIELAPTTLFQLPGLREQAFMKMVRFVRKVPAFNLQLSSDITNLPFLLESFIKTKWQQNSETIINSSPI